MSKKVFFWDKAGIKRKTFWKYGVVSHDGCWDLGLCSSNDDNVPDLFDDLTDAEDFCSGVNEYFNGEGKSEDEPPMVAKVCKVKLRIENYIVPRKRK